jgi:pimeloyl-ACP methyl ester carboxylesterase
MMALAPDAQVEQEVIDIMVSDSLKASDGFLEQAMADLEGLDLGSKLSRIDLPALMIHGDRDAAVPMADSIKTFERISGCSLHVFYGCGHSPQVECGEDFLNLLISFSRNPRKREDIAGQA